ncbi:MAG: hypothetical protein GY805_30410 [Chloroflexi bacterium]|nr:hypothetical protein [Chloroflexota bacterium]
MNKLTLFVMLGLGAMALGLVGRGWLGRKALAQGEKEPLALASDNSLALNQQTQMGSEHFGLDWNVVASGGNTMSSAHFGLASTTGQTTIGNSSSANFAHRAGFWQTLLHRIFLPYIAKNM